MDCCSQCPQNHRQVQGHGPRDAEYLLCGESPGRDEDRQGIPFVGRSGQEQDYTYMRLAGLDRSQFYVTNAVMCRCERNGVDSRPSESLLKSCADHHLWREIFEVNPRVLVLAGAAACSLFGIDLELEHGFPREATVQEEYGGWSGWVVPMYHPAAGMHETRFMTPLLEDWEKLGQWIRGEWKPPSSGTKPNYHLLTGDEVADITHRAINRRPRRSSVDTESDENRPYSIQFSVKAGEGFMVLVDDKKGIQWLRRFLNDEDELVMHNAIYDLDQLEQAGIRPRRFRDTMQELYHLGNLPQGLKQAVYRIFGFKMTSYDEVVTPFSKEKLEQWLLEALATTQSWRWETVHPVGKGCPVCGKSHRKELIDSKPHEAESVLRRVLKHLHGDYDPWTLPKLERGEEKTRLLGRDWLEPVEQDIGRMPRKSIVHAPIEQQVQYAVGDADWTLRLALWLEKERARIVQQEWKVA